jgi:hypothetical protein
VYLVQNYDVLLHGSSESGIETLEPRKQAVWNDEDEIFAVFATADGIWPMFFALIDWAKFYRGSIRNGCFVADVAPAQSERFYFFSVTVQSLARQPWTQGTIYVLPRQGFEPTHRGPVRFDEWACKQTVPVMARLTITVEDFPFFNSITGHPEEESIIETWLHFKERLGQQLS